MKGNDNLMSTRWWLKLLELQGLEEYGCFEVLRDQPTLQLLCSSPASFLRIMYMVANSKEGADEAAAEVAADGEAPAEGGNDGAEGGGGQWR